MIDAYSQGAMYSMAEVSLWHTFMTYTLDHDIHNNNSSSCLLQGHTIRQTRRIIMLYVVMSCCFKLYQNPLWSEAQRAFGPSLL